jgi:hypothetical protein
MADLTRWNRAGLARVRYVDGNAAVWRARLHAALAARFPAWPLPPADDDARADWGWEIARAFARSTHVLTEHLDRYANEGYLGTAGEWDSVRRLVAMLDYAPAPPASASTPLALDAKAAGTLAAGLQLKHSPPDGGPPVVFETLEDLELDPALNALRARGHDRNPQPLTGRVLALETRVEELAAGQPLLLEDERDGSLRAYLIDEVRQLDDHTELAVSPPLAASLMRGHTLVHLLPRERLAPLGPVPAGAVAIERVLHLAAPPAGLLPNEVVYVSDGVNAYHRRVTHLRATALVLDRALGPLDTRQASVGRPVQVSVSRISERLDGAIVALALAGDWSRLAGARVAHREAGQVANYEVMAADYRAPVPGDPASGYTTLRLSRPAGEPVLANPQHLLVPPPGAGPWATDSYIAKDHGHLPRELVTPLPKHAAVGAPAVLVMGAQLAWGRLEAIALDRDAGEARLAAAWADRGGGDWYLAASRLHAGFKLQARLHGWQHNATPLAGRLVPLAGSAPAALAPGRKLIVEGGGEAQLSSLVEVQPSAQGDALLLADDLPAGTTYATLLLSANVVRAGHGERRPAKILGNGDAIRSRQRFVLAEKDVAFVADRSQRAGVAAAITVTVDGQAWDQLSTLNEAAPEARAYTVRLDEDGLLEIGFGDGVHGRRLPTGSGNVRVEFRVGTGLAGNLAAASLTRPAKPHPRIAAVRQPLPATGGNDREPVESLRRAAPATVLTLERAVALADFEHLVASHASVWQARAFRRPAPGTRGARVEVVVVPAGGGALAPELAEELRAYLAARALPGVRIRVSRYTPRALELAAALGVDASLGEPETILAAARGALLAAFALETRSIGDDAFLSAAYATIENVSGVVNSRIGIFATDTTPGLQRRIGAGPAELLYLPESRLGLTAAEALP